MKRIMLILVIIALFVLQFSVYTRAASSVDIVITVNPTRAQKGDILDFKISIRNYGDNAVPDIGGLQVDIPISPVYFEYVAKSEKILLPVEPGDVISSSFNGRKDQFSIIYVSMNADSKPLARDAADVVSFRLKVKQQIPLNKVIEISGKAVIATTSSPAEKISNQVISAELRSSGPVPTTSVAIPTVTQPNQNNASSPGVSFSENNVSQTTPADFHTDETSEISSSSEDHPAQSTVGLSQFNKDQSQTMKTERSYESGPSDNDEKAKDVNNIWVWVLVLGVSSILFILLFGYHQKKKR